MLRRRREQMFNRIRAALAACKICAVFLLSVVPIATLIPGGDVALGQTGTGTSAQVPLFTTIDINPDGFVESWASVASDGQQVGYGFGPATGGYVHGLLWRGTVSSVPYLTP